MKNWYDALKYFVAIADNGGFAQAARKHYTSASALSKQIAWLESRLQQRLFERTTRAVHLTTAGKALYPRAKAWLCDLADMCGDVHDVTQELSGMITIAAPVRVGEEELTTILCQFQSLHPKVRINMLFDDGDLNMYDLNIDMKICSYRSTQQAYHYNELKRMKRCVVASPEYLAAHGKPSSPAELKNHQCLSHRDYRFYGVWTFKHSGAVQVNTTLFSTGLSSLVKACLAGRGILYSSQPYLQSYLDKGELVLLFEDDMPDPWPIYLVTINESLSDPTVKACYDYIASALAENHHD